MGEEIPLGEDFKDWNSRITDAERNLLTQVFRFFTQSDVEVQDNYMERYARVFRPTEIKMMLAAFTNMETVHIAAYALLLETLGMPDSEFAAFLDYAEMRDKPDYMQTSASTRSPTCCARWRCSAASPRACSCSPASRSC